VHTNTTLIETGPKLSAFAFAADFSEDHKGWLPQILCAEGGNDALCASFANLL